MRKNCGNIVGPLATSVIVKTLHELVSHFTTSVYADGEEGGEVTGEVEKPATVNFEDLISKARADEKKKHYATIERLKGQIEVLNGQHNDDLLKVAGLEKELKEAKAKLTATDSGDSEAVATLKKDNKALQVEKDALEQKVAGFEANKPVSREELEKEIRAELEAEYEVKTFKATKLAELKDQILVPELVMGDTKEAIELSIEAAVKRSEEIRKSLGIGADTNTQKKRTPRSVANPSMSRAQDNKYTLEYIQSLNPGSEEYRKYREDVGLANKN